MARNPRKGLVSAICEGRAIWLGRRAFAAAQIGDLGRCEKLNRKALAILEGAFGDVFVTAHYVNNLAGILAAQERYPEAEPLWRRAIAIYEKEELGPDQPHMLGMLRGLADALLAQGVGDSSSATSRHKCAEAEALYRRLLDTHPASAADPRSLSSTEASPASEHANEVRTLNGLAEALWVQGKVAEAELSYQRAVEILEAVSGSDDLDLATTLSNLASLYVAQGKYADAEPLLRRALEILEAAWGPDPQRGEPGHEEVAMTSEKLRSVLDQLGAKGLPHAKTDWRHAVRAAGGRIESIQRLVNPASGRSLGNGTGGTMSDEVLEEVENYYYRSGSPEKAVAALEHYVTSETLLESANPAQSNPALYLFSRISELNPGLIRKYEALFDKASGKGKVLLIWLLELAGDGQTRVFLDSQLDEFGTARHLEAKQALEGGHPFKSNPFNRYVRDGMDLDLLWCEFILTGNQEAVVRIVGVLDWPDLTRERLGDWLRSREVIPIPYWSRARRKRVVKRLRDGAQIVCDVDRQEITTAEDLDCRCMMEELAMSRERLEQVTRALPFQLSP